MKYLYCDFEFNRTAEPTLNLVSCALDLREGEEVLFQETYWLLDNAEKLALSKLLSRLLSDVTLVSFALQAEARCLFDLCPHLTPKDLTGIDLYLNYRMLLNHNDRLCYGKQLIRGEERVTKKPKPKYERTEQDLLDDSQKPEYSLAAACYKLLGVKIDTDHKKKMRDLIIANKDLEENREAILSYGLQDVEHLPALMAMQRSELIQRHDFTDKDVQFSWKNMAEYAVRSAWMERLGYPVEVKELKKFVSKIPDILTKAAGLVNSEHPDVKAFELNPKTSLYVKKEKPIKDWITSNHDEKLWMKTDKGQPSMSLDAFRRFYDSQDQTFGGAMVRYLKTKQSLNGFTPSNNSKRGSFFDYLGTDGRARPYFGIYGSQSSRSQPSATGYLPLKAHWMRYFIQPPKGRAILGIDYASQEFLIAALLSEDTDMVKAYASGDVYLAFGKQAGFIPPEGTKKSHAKERDIFKQLVLGVSYDMSDLGLALRLSQITGQQWTKEKAGELIDTFYETYPEYADWKKDIAIEYFEENKLSLKDGWTMLGDNDNRRSVGNYPVQGAGAAIMRKAVALAQDYGIDLIFTLHDAIYAEIDSYDPVAPTLLGQCMVEAFMWYFDDVKESRLIRLDGFQWSHDYKEKMPEFQTFFPIKFSQRYVDSKGEKDLNTYKEFFE